MSLRYVWNILDHYPWSAPRLQPGTHSVAGNKYAADRTNQPHWKSSCLPQVTQQLTQDFKNWKHGPPEVDWETTLEGSECLIPTMEVVVPSKTSRNSCSVLSVEVAKANLRCVSAKFRSAQARNDRSSPTLNFTSDALQPWIPKIPSAAPAQSICSKF